MRIALIFPNFYETERRVTASIHAPLSLGYIAAILKQYGHNIKIFDAAGERINLKKLMQKLEEFAPDVIGLTSNISIAFMCQVTAKRCRRFFPKTQLLIGGPWASANYEYLLEKNLATIVTIGEGEETVAELIDCFEKKGDFSKITGIAYRDVNGSIIKTPPRELIKDLNKIPFPAWELFPNPQKYNLLRRGKRFYPVLTSRGCPYQCIHCTKIVFGHIMRYRSIDNVIQEIIYLRKQFGAQEILIIDDAFTQNLPRAIRILLFIARLPFKIKIQFSNGIRADKVTNLLLDAMRVAGVYRIAFGIESGCQDVVNFIGKKLSLKDVEETAKLFHNRFNFVTVGFFILGHPVDTRQTIDQTIQFAKKLDFDFAHFFKNLIFPGSKQYEIVQNMGGKILVKDFHGIPGGFNRPEATFETNSLKSRDIEKAYTESYKNFYLRPLKLIIILSKIRSKYEISWVLHYAWNSLRYLFRDQKR